MKKYVLTGGPSAGKTTLIEILARRGYTVIPEAARLVIDEEKTKGGNPFGDFATLQKKIVAKQLEQESTMTGDVVFLDRSLIDGYAYCLYGNIPVPPEIMNIERGKFDKVFLLQPTGAQKKDTDTLSHRKDFDQIQENLRLAYQKFGYELTEVPPLPPEERADFVIAAIQ